MQRNWIQFDGYPTQARSDEVSASLNHRGEIVMNGHTFNELGSPEWVVLLFDPDTDTIGLKPASPLMPHIFHVKAKGRVDHRVIRVAPFMRRHDIRIDGTIRFRTAAVEDGILVLSLRNMVNAARGPKKVSRRR